MTQLPSFQKSVPEATRWPLPCATLSRYDPLSSARNRCAVSHYHNPAWTEESRFRGALDDVIIIPLVFVALVANKILRFILSILMRLLDYAFPLAMQIVWLPLFAARVLGNVIVTVINGALRFLPLSETKRRQWSISIRRNWSWLRPSCPSITGGQHRPTALPLRCRRRWLPVQRDEAAERFVPRRSRSGPAQRCWNSSTCWKVGRFVVGNGVGHQARHEAGAARRPASVAGSGCRSSAASWSAALIDRVPERGPAGVERRRCRSSAG